MKLAKEAKDSIKEGFNKINSAIAPTMGYNGKLALIEHAQDLNPHSSKDGVTISAYAYADCQYSELGAKLLKTACNKSLEENQDGTTSTSVLSTALVNNAFEELDLVNHVELVNGIKKAQVQALKILEKLKKPVTDKEIVQIATVSANNNAELGKQVAEIYKKIGLDSTIEVSLGNSEKTTVNYVEGININRGFALTYFINNFEKAAVELEDAKVMIFNGEIKTVSDISEQVGQCITAKTPLLIICDDIQETVMTALVKLKMEGTLQVCVCISPEYGAHREAVLEDLAISLGCEVFKPKFSREIVLGHAKKIISLKEKTVILPTDESDLVDLRVETLKAQLEISDKFETDNLKKRIANLKSAVAEITVGGTSEIDIKERKDLIDDAVGSVRSAILGGFVSGGGSTLAFISHKLKNNLKGGEFVGFEVFKKSLLSPYTQILRNGGLNSEDYPIERYGKGMNLAKRKQENLIKSGIIDSAKVVESVINNSTSVAITAINTDVLILTR